MNRMAERVVSPVLLVVVAPSGAGKTTVSRGLLEANPNLERVVTCTTRKPRTGEQNGIDYHFLDESGFASRLAAGEFLESATVYGNHYGTLKSEVSARLERGADVLLSVDVQGAESIRDEAAVEPLLREALVSVFLMPPSFHELQRRLTLRNQDPPDVIQRRLAVAHEEMSHWRHFDYVVVSGSIQEDFDAMQQILTTEKLKTHRIRHLVVE